MCWNEPVSWTTFFIGTFFNIFNICYFKNKTLTAVSILLEWLLLMQLFEALIWRSQNSTEKSQLNKIATNGAMIANLTQPIILAFLFIAISDNQINKYFAIAVIMIYICYILYCLNQTSNYNSIDVKSQKDCVHIDLKWWKNISGGVYVATLFVLIFLLIRPLKFAFLVGGYIALSLIISLMFYSCSVGSMWCWFTAFAPIVFGLYFWFQ